MLLRLISVLLCGVVAGIAPAQPIGGPRTFPQFRDMAGLSGNGFPVTPRGDLGMNGAISLSTPIAYLLRPGRLLIGGASRSFDTRFRWVNTEFAANAERSDGTFQVHGSVATPWGAVALTHHVGSPKGDSVQNLQFKLPSSTENWAWSAGVHNITNRPRAAGDNLPVEDAALSRSFFVAGTMALDNDTYLTLGAGTTRYRGVFGSLSRPVARNLRFFGEYDTFNWNYGVATGLRVAGHPAFITAGFVRGNLATWTLNVSF